MLINLYSKHKSTYYQIKKNNLTGLTSKEKLALINLKKDRSIIICKPDKGRGVTIINISEYLDKINKIFSNETIFKQIDHDETLKKLKQFQGFLYRLKKNKYLDEEGYQFLRPTAAATPTLYGLPKLLKENIPMRPTFASKDSFNYQAAVWLNNILTPL